MANTATAIYIDTYGSGSKQTGHPEFELSEPLNYSPFTVEFWYKHVYTSWNDWSTFMSITNTTAGADNTTASSAGSDVYFMGQYGSGQNYYASTIYQTDGTGGGTIDSNVVNYGEIIRNTHWQHVAFTRTHNGFSGIWHNGVLIGGAVNAYGDRIVPGKRVELGYNRFDTGNYPFKGYMDEVRISKIARYGNIDIPTAPLKTWQVAGRGQNALLPHHTKLLIQANSSTTTSSSIIDQSASGHTVSATNVAHSQGRTNFGNTALYFDGSGDYLDIASHADFAILVQDFSAECWYYRGGTSPTNQWIFSGRDANHFDLGLYGTNRIDVFVEGNDLSTGTTVNTAEGWHHIAFGKSNNMLCIWLNGRLVAWEETGVSIAQTGLYIGRQHTSDTSEALNGYLDGIRVCVGRSAYTPNFVPYGAQKNLAVNRGGAVTDVKHSSANTHAIRMGQAAIGSTLATNANTYCLDFDGTNDYLLRNEPNWRGADDRGTVFAWVYFDDLTGAQVIFSKADTADTGEYWMIQMSASGKLHVDDKADGSSNEVLTSSTHLTATTWHSVAVVSTGSAYTFYVDGTARATSGTNDGGWINGMTDSDNITIGALKYNSVVSNFDGKIMQVAYWGGASGTTGVLDADAIAALHAAGKGYDIKGSGNTGNYDSWADDLKGYWQMGNHYLDTPTAIYDASGNGYDMHEVSDPPTLTWSTGTTFLTNWQDRGYFTPDKYTSLLLQSSTHEGSTTFTDSGPGFKKTTFDGTDDRAHKTSLTNYRSSDTVGSIVAWVKPAAGKDNHGIFCYADTAGTANYFYLSTNSDYRLIFQPVVSASSRGGQIYTATNKVPLNTWTLVALTYDDTQYRMYINGVEETITNLITGTDAATTWFNDLGSGVFDAICVGALLRSTDVHEFNGHIAGVGVWSSTLTATQLAAIHDLGPGGNWKTSYSSGLVDYWTFGNQIGEGTDSSSTIYSQVASGNDLTTSGTMAAPFAGHTLTGGGGVIHTTARSVFGGSSMYFDASNNRVIATENTDLRFGTGPFTIEFWVYMWTAASDYILMDHRADTQANGGWSFYVDVSECAVGFDRSNGSSWTAGLKDTSMPATDAVDKWRHVAVTQDSSTLSMLIDGVVVDTSTTLMSDVGGTYSVGVAIGGGYNNGGTYTDGFLSGSYMDEVRLSNVVRYSKAIERYSNTFVTKGDTGDAFTALQIQSNGVKDGTQYSDILNRTGFNTSLCTPEGRTTWLSNVGDAFGGGNTALYFNGVDDNLTFADSADWDLGEKCTIETWMYCVSMPSSGWAPIMSSGDFTGSSTAGWSFTTWNTGSIPRLGFLVNNTWNNAKSVEFKLNVWNHVALTRDNGTYTIWMNGVQQHKFSYGTTPVTATSLIIGKSYYLSAKWFNGYMDQIRVSKGIARYGGASLANTQQVVTSSNSDTQVVTSNSTFGTGDNAFTTDSYTAILVNGDENWGGTTSATLSVGGTGPGPVSSGTVTLTNNSTATQRRGISAFGANSYFIDGTDTDEGLYVQMSNNTALANLHSFTVEGWYKSSFTANKFLWAAQYDSTDAWDYDMIGSYHESAVLLRTNWDVSGTASNYVNVPTSAHADDQWHHFAWQYDFNSTPYPTVQTIIDGQIIDSSSWSVMTIGNKDYSDGKFWIGNGGDIVRAMTGFIDSWRFSANILRYGFTGTNLKKGLNAVHHSQCKLLVTSNTFSGNTHFDDFSDQGNYWNQTPYNYFFSRAPYLKNVNAGNMARSIMDSDVAGSIAAWVMIRPGATLSQKTIISFTDTGATNQYFQFDVNEQSPSSHILGIGEVYNGSPQSNILGTSVPIEEGIWYLAGCVSTGTAYKLYLNGIDIGGTTSGTQGDWISDCNGDGDLDNVNVGELMRSSGGGEWDGRIAQVAVWGNTSDTAQGGVGVLSTAQFQAMYEAGPTANWKTDYQTNMRLYYAMGNHNSLGGRGNDTGDICYDRSGNEIDLTIGDGNAIYSPHKGNLILPTGTVKHSTDASNFGSSSMFFDGDSDYLVVQNTSVGEFGDDKHSGSFTIEGWLAVRGQSFGSGSTRQGVISRRTSGQSSDTAGGWFLNVRSSQLQFGGRFDSGWHDGNDAAHGIECSYPTDGAWHHFAVQRVGDSNTTCSYDIYVDGILGASFYQSGTANHMRGQDGDKVCIGNNAYNNESSTFFGGYMDEIAIYKGVAKYNAVTLPGQATITPSALSDPSGNHFTTASHVIEDQMLDTPENNFCTLNPLHKTGGTYTESNLRVVSESSTYKQYYGSMGVSTGKWYFETKIIDGGSVAPNTQLGIQGDFGQGFDANGTADGNAGITGGNASSFAYRDNDGEKYTAAGAGDGKEYGNTYANNDVIGTIVDLDNGKIWWSKNGDIQLDGDPANGLGFAFDTLLSHSQYYTGQQYFPAIHLKHDGDTGEWHFNFGQGDPDGENNYTDSNGRGGFRYEPPAEFLSWCTANMEDDDYAPIGPNSTTGAPDEHFDIVLYNGAGMTASNDPKVSSRRINGLNFQPDLVLIKNRGTTDCWSLQDSVRGWGYSTKLSIYDTAHENDASEGSYGNYGFVSGAFDGGFEICPGTSPGQVDKDTSNNFVAFSWKAGNETTQNDDGASQSTVSVNQDAGFSIVSWTGDGAATTVGHGLTKAPEFIIVKNRELVSPYAVYHKDLADDQYLRLNENGAAYTASSRFNSTDPTATVFSTGNDSSVAENGDGLIAYCWHGVEGFSKFGSYTANDNADGPFIYCGFKPAMVIIKNISNAQYWHMQDNKRSPYNPCDNAIFPNATNAETDNGDIDFLANGFKIRTTENTTNQSTDTFVYMVWAEMPFKYARAR